MTLMTVNENQEKIQENPSEPQAPKEHEKKSPQYEELILKIADHADAESKLNLVILAMESSISREGSPNFKFFWEARTLCLDLLKEKMPPQARSMFWEKYRELSKEARKLKEILDQESHDIAEQIEIAIQDLEQELSHTEIPKIDLTFISQSRALSNHASFYEANQTELSHLNTLASRIHAFRKELIKTELRIGTKNKFFHRLSAIGDQIFPKRKELIKQISDQFSQDVSEFIQKNFENKGTKQPPFALKEEIKTLQMVAKFLTLNTQSFNATRLQLSECWDILKNSEKERKKQFAEKKAISKQNAEPILAKIQAIQEALQKEELSPNDANSELDMLLSEMRRIDLDRDDVKLLKESIAEARKPIQEFIVAQEEEKNKKEQEKKAQKLEKVEKLQEQIKELLKIADSRSMEELQKEKEELSLEIQNSSLNKVEKQDLEKLLRPIKDLLTEKKEKLLLSLPEDQKAALSQLKELLAQRKEKKAQITTQLDQLRKAGGFSGLDIEKAMEHTQLVKAEKEKLEKITLGIKEIEEKIEEIES